jgi:hydroxylysine kinase
MSDGVDAFMATMVAQSRPVPIERAVALVRERYGFQADAAPLTGERDENFKLTAADGAQYVLKIANLAENAAVSDLLTAALLHLQATDPSFPCPRVVRELEGGTQVRFFDEAGSERTARVLTYLPGLLLGSATRSRLQRAACGRIGGRLTRALRSFEHPAAHRAIIWDVRHARHMSRLLEQLPHFPYRPLAVDLLTRMVPAIEARLPHLRHQVVHNDLNPLNILVEPTDEARVSGVIDFGDTTYTALIADVAVAAAELIAQDCTDPDSALESVLDVAIAYHECVPLLQQELTLLGTLVAARLLMNVVVHEWHVHHNPSNSHYAALHGDFMRARLEIADRLLLEEITL